MRGTTPVLAADEPGNVDVDSGVAVINEAARAAGIPIIGKASPTGSSPKGNMTKVDVLRELELNRAARAATISTGTSPRTRGASMPPRSPGTDGRSPGTGGSRPNRNPSDCDDIIAAIEAIESQVSALKLIVCSRFTTD